MFTTIRNITYLRLISQSVLALIWCTACLIALNFEARTQNNIEGNLSINTLGTLSDASAILDVQSASKGVLMPRMTSVQRGLISSPVEGLIVFDTDLKTYCYYDSLTWVCIPRTSGLCTTLDEAYDCGGAGNGRVVTVDAGSVRLNGTVAGIEPTLKVNNSSTGSVATFRDMTAGAGGTENLVIIGQDNGHAVESQVLGAGNTNNAIYAFTNSTMAQAGVFRNTAGASTADALEGYNQGMRHGVYGHTDTKMPVFGSFSISGLPASGVMGVSSGSEARKGTSGVSVASDGVWGKTWVSASGYKSVADPRNIIAGVHGTIESAQSTTESKDFIGVFGIPKNNGVGVLGVGGPQNGVKGHGVIGVSAWSTNTPSTNAGLWGVTREASTWAALQTRFPLEEEMHNKIQVGVLGQSEHYVAVWGESLQRIGVVGSTNTRLSNAQVGAIDRGVYGHNGGGGFGVDGQSLGTDIGDAGVRATGQFDKDKANALIIHDGAIRVTKDSAMDTPADVIDVTVSGWNLVPTCEAGDPLHSHIQAFISDPIAIPNQYVDATRSVILVSVFTTIPGVSVQLSGHADGIFGVVLTIHSANAYCGTNPPSSGFKIHYMIVNK